MDGAKLALDNRGMTVVAERKIGKVESPGAYVTNVLHAAIFACPCVLSDRPLMLWWYHLESGGMRLG